MMWYSVLLRDSYDTYRVFSRNKILRFCDKSNAPLHNEARLLVKMFTVSVGLIIIMFITTNLQIMSAVATMLVILR